ncbi:MAG TPA: molybdenum ABC transporter ATP-binding protein [Xanthobacteraceae bacterium]|jgi:molybdate transport system ATP-binding protein|nr:molybdenum ABC transporter ATP-binding protein [Xanthobacteraceae bacterium]
MTIEVDVAHRLGAFTLEVRFTSQGRLTAFFGPSGSGKTSLVNVIGGLIRPDRGRIAVDATTLTDTASGIFVPMHRRRIGYVFQEGRLFPHLTVRQNLMFGRWFTPPQERKVELETVLDLLGIGHLLHRRPGGLSGGEKQRVAIGRALLASPRLLLMDEPLAALDEERKAEILPFIERLRDEANIPIIYVSHSLAEVSRLANSVVVLHNGRVAAAGDPAEVLSRSELVPQDAVEEAGAVIEARISQHDIEFGLTMLQSNAGLLRAPYLDLPAGTIVRVRIRARDVMVANAPPLGLSALNVLAGKVIELRTSGESVAEVAIDCNGVKLWARLTRKSVETLGLKPELPVFAILKSVALDKGTLGKSPLSENLRGADLGVRLQDEGLARRLVQGNGGLP